MKRLVWFAGVLMAVVGMFTAGVQAQEVAGGSEDAPVACSSCNGTDGCGQCGCTDDSVIYFGGYMNAGYLASGRDRDSSYYLGPTNCWGEGTGALNGIYLETYKKATTYGCGVDWGFGMDIMFGQDSRWMRSYVGLDSDWGTGQDGRGNDTYGFAMPQMYAELAVNNWSVKGGHFYTLLGVESAKASERFFYSEGLGFQSLPVTHSGVLVSYNGCQNLDFIAGWVNGNNNMFENEYDDSMFTCKITWRMNECMKVSYAVVWGDMWAGNLLPVSISDGLLLANGSIHTAAFHYDISCATQFILAVNYANLDATYNDNPMGEHKYTVVSAHLYHTLNACWKVGTRMEWAVYENDMPESDRPEIYSLAFGANWTLSENLVIRPELRYDHATVDCFDNFQRGDQTTLGIDVMFIY